MCPRVAVRFAGVLRLKSDLVVDPGDAAALAESLAEAVEAHWKLRRVGKGRDEDQDDEDQDDKEDEEEDDEEDDEEDEKDTPVARAGAVVELLCWRGEGESLSPTAADVLTRACVESGAAGA